MPEYDYDLFTIGAGSGGVRAGRVAAAHGAKVAVAEEYRVGGTCVIRGCVPKKMLVYGAHFAEDLEDARQFGWHIEGATFDWISLRDTVLADVDRLNGIYTGTLENHGVEIFHERAVLTGPHDIRLASGRTVTAKNILICTGARPHVPQFPGCEHGITSNEAFHLDALPSRVLIAGAGYIANEFAGIFHQFGCEVTIINRSDQLLRSYDQALRDRLLPISVTKGIRLQVNSTFARPEKPEDGVEVQLHDLLPAGVLHRLQRRHEGIAASIVDQDVESAHACECLLDDACCGIGLGDVCLDHGARAADRAHGLRDLSERLRIPCGDRHVGALGGEAQRDGAADAARGAGDEGVTSGEGGAAVHGCSFAGVGAVRR